MLAWGGGRNGRAARADLGIGPLEAHEADGNGGRPPESVNAGIPRLAFVGVGWIGGLRLDAVEEAGAAEVGAICECDPERLRELGERFPSAFSHEESEAVLDFAADRELDGVVLATPNALHAPQAHAALERGLPLFIQKPLGLDPDEVAGVLTRAKAADRLVEVDYSYRHLNGARLLRKLVQDDALGDVHLVEAVFHNAYGPDKAWCFDTDMSGGGALLDLGVHLLDLAFWMFETSEPRRIQGTVRDLEAHAGIDRFAAAEMVLDPDIHFRLTSSWNAHAGCDCDFRFTVHGTEAGAELRNRHGSFYDFELALRTGRTEEILARDSRTWMHQGILEWIGRLGEGNGFDPGARTNLAVATVVDELYGRVRG